MSKFEVFMDKATTVYLWVASVAVVFLVGMLVMAINLIATGQN